LCILGETPLHIAVFYNDISSVQLLVKHGADVNQRVIGDFFPNRIKTETKTGRRNRTSRFFQRDGTAEKLITFKNSNPESRLNFLFFENIFKG
jgi:ankyrin repeat protein